MTGDEVEVVELPGPGLEQVEVVEVGATDALAGAQIVSVTPTAGSGTPAIRSSLDELRDVDAPPAPLPASPAVLVRGPDNVYRPVDVAQVAPPQRGSVVHYLEQNPSDPPQQARAGDWVTVIAGAAAGTVYHVQEA